MASATPSHNPKYRENPMQIEAYNPSHLEEILKLSLLAWSPVFASLEIAMTPAIYKQLVPDWQTYQTEAVAAVCKDEKYRVWVALQDGQVAGFSAIKFDEESKLGEIYMIAVSPQFQRQGIAKALMERSIQSMKEAGMTVAMVETGGDPGHAPARATYENFGFNLFPVSRYFMHL